MALVKKWQSSIPEIPLVVLGAVSFEIGPLREKFSYDQGIKTSRPLKLEVRQGPKGPVYFGLTGMGPRLAQRSMQELLRLVRPQMIISVGLAGALQPDMKVGDLVLAQSCHRLRSLSPIELDAQSWHPNFPLETIASRIQSPHHRVFTGPILSSPEIITQGGTKAKLARLAIKPLAVEMETAAILDTLDRADCPDTQVLCLRAISDTSKQDLPMDFSQFHTLTGRIKPFSFLRYFFRNPDAAWSVFRLVQHSNRATHNLARALHSNWNLIF